MLALTDARFAAILGVVTVFLSAVVGPVVMLVAQRLINERDKALQAELEKLRTELTKGGDA